MPQMQRLLSHRYATPVFLVLIAMIFVAMWIPNSQYTLNSDPVGYAHLSKSFWEEGNYSIMGKPDDVFVPGTTIISYPFIALFGLNDGMKTASLVYGILFAFTFFGFLMLQLKDKRWIAFATVALLPFSFYTTWLLSVGNADLLYGFLFFLTLVVYLKAEKNPALYPLIGVLIGITMLTRYMGVALLPIIGLDVLIRRRHHLFHPAFLSIFPIAIAIFSLWFVRHKITFGTWFSTFHVGFGLSDQTPIPVRVIRNTLFYLNPLHSILLLFPFSLVGIWNYWKKYLLITIAIPFSLLLCYVYPSVTTRFMVVTIPMLLFFAVLGIKDVRKFLPLWIITPYLTIALLVQAGFTCLYTWPACNAAVDRLHLSFIPEDLDLTQERQESLREAITWINENARRGRTVISSSMQLEDIDVWRDAKVFREDFRLALYPSCEWITYEINEAEKVPADAEIVYVTMTKPTEVVRVIDPRDCKKPLGRDPEARYW